VLVVGWYFVVDFLPSALLQLQ